MVSQVYFFTVINGILDKELVRRESLKVLLVVVGWSSFFFAVIFFAMSIFCWIVSISERRGGSVKWLVFGVAVVDCLRS